ncbi:hypothetical protein DPMN_125057 [Dreissena polymorpha]|uniref:Uncharacterized protein n=1 Tax=Dreissena polymorpha TaxID=45954 RepID=A0A9D4GWT1_DREPO|nr:hypothetical protein DPMN_125057 [Dreissena polymorpha]
MAAKQHAFEAISKDFDKIRAESQSLTDEVVDLKDRSMRNNLLVFNFDKETLSPIANMKIVPIKSMNSVKGIWQ